MATSQLVMNGENYESSTGRFLLNFATPQKFNNTQISVSQVSMFNSFSNITEELGNNRMSVFFPDGNTHKEYLINIPDGYYSVETFDTWLKKEFDKNYLYTTQGESMTHLYPFHILQNNHYQTILIFGKVSAQDHTKPTEATWTMPPTNAALTPYFVVPQSLGKLFGYLETTLGNGQGYMQNIPSTTVPAINQVQSLIFSCNLVGSSQGISYPSDLITTLPVAGVGYGSMISKSYAKREWFDIPSNSEFRELSIQVRDQILKQLKIHDTNILILLSFRENPK